MTESEDRAAAAGRRICLVVSRFNQIVTSRLEEEARKELLRRGVEESHIEVFYVPGAWELTAGVRRAVESGRYAAIVALGCVVRGETPHFETICRAVSVGLTALSARGGPPIALGVLTTETLQQALDRAGGRVGNQGAAAASAALEMCALFEQLP